MLFRFCISRITHYNKLVLQKYSGFRDEVTGYDNFSRTSKGRQNENVFQNLSPKKASLQCSGVEKLSGS